MSQSAISVAIPSLIESNLADSSDFDFAQALRYHFHEKPENFTCVQCGHPNLLVKSRYHNGIPR